MLLSIIAPVYNVDDYLSEFVYSLEKLDYLRKYYELILVDDGSTDESGKICDKLSKTYNNINVIHKNNSGLANARNTGLEQANGKYVFFADSDDVFNTSELENVLCKLKKFDLDLMIMPFNILHKNGTLSINSYIEYIKKGTIFEFCSLLASKDQQLPWAAFQNIILKEFLTKNHLKFDINYNGAEDLKMFSDILINEPSYDIYPNAIINYRSNREGSINNTKNYSSVMGQLKAYVDAISDLSSYYQIKRYLTKRLFDTLIQILMIKNKEDQEKCLNFIHKNREFLDSNDLSIKYKIMNLMLKKLGLKAGIKIIFRIYKLYQK